MAADLQHHHEVEYPQQFPVACITSAISIFRGGRAAIVSERQTLGLDVWGVQGYAQRVFIGVPEGPHTFGEDPQAQPLLAELCATSGQALGQFGENFGARDWKALLKWFMENIAPLLLPLILEEQAA